MRGYAAGQSRILRQLADESANVLRRRGSAPGIDEKRLRRALARVASVSVRDDQLADLGVGDIDTPLPASLPDNRDDAGRQVDVVVPKSGEFRDADAGGEE